VPVSAHTQVTDLALNDHACLTFGEQEELLDLTAAFVRDGLASGSRVVMLSDAPQITMAKLGGHEMTAESAVAATYHDDPVLRICRQYVPPGVRLAGELDFLAREALALALGEAIRIDGDITINMTHLSSIDAASMRMILEAAASLGPSRTVVLRCRPAVEARFTQLGVDLLPHVSLVGVHD
jgi:anti-anti-sigma regulatory factor